MTHSRLLSWLQAAHHLRLRETEAANKAEVEHRMKDCLTVARARDLYFDPEQTTEQEAQHLTICRGCQKLRQEIEKRLPHPPWWSLIQEVLPSGPWGAVEDDPVRCWVGLLKGEGGQWP
jgi:hypothetical protein